MSVHRIVMFAALCAFAVLDVAASASAATFIRQGSTTGPTYQGPFTVAQIGTSTVVATDGSGITLSCPSGSMSGSLGASGGASVTATVSALDFGLSNDCSSNTTPVTNGCHLVSASTLSMTASGAGTGNFVFPGLSLHCDNNFFGPICTFDWTNVTGHVFDTGTTGTDITFTNAGPITSSSFGCPSNIHFSGTFGPLLGSGGVKLYVSNA